MDLLNLTIFSPLEQFQLVAYIPLKAPMFFDLSLTNSSVVMLVLLSVTRYIYTISLKEASLVPSNWQSALEMYYEGLENILTENVGTKAKIYFPFIFTLFTFILLLNLFGMVPYVFSTTAHFSVALTLSFSIWLSVTILGFSLHGFNFLSMFMPAGAPIALAPLLVIIELISYLARAISLGLRLAANITAGHLLLVILAGFAWTMIGAGNTTAVAAFLPLLIIYVLTFLEIAVCLIQAYVFTLLACIYLNDAINVH